MKNKSKRMQMLVKLAEKQEQDMVKQLGLANQKLNALQQQLQKLYQYRENYSQHFRASTENTLSSSSIRDYILFVNSLNNNIDKLNQAISEQNNQVEKVRQVWMEKHQQTDIYLNIQEKYQNNENKLKNKQEQKISDEFSTNFYIRNQTNNKP